VIEPLFTNSRLPRQIMVMNSNSEFHENTTEIEPLFTNSRLPRQIYGKELQLWISWNYDGDWTAFHELTLTRADSW